MKSVYYFSIGILLSAFFNTAFAFEGSGYTKLEIASYVSSGSPTGSKKTMLDPSENDADIMKIEPSIRLFLNGDFGENISWHADINMICDTKAVNDNYECAKSYTQNDWFRELYFDTKLGQWDLRLGKQQEVWGTADGIKLLDIVNPTDFRELNQNAIEDARIPVWMAKAERNIGESSNVQFLISQPKANRIPGLNADGDAGHPFIFKGVDSITGEVHGFLNVAPALGGVATSFSAGAIEGLIPGGGGQKSPIGLVPYTGITVDGFASGAYTNTMTGNLADGHYFLNNIAQHGLIEPGNNQATIHTTTGNNFGTNLMNVSGTGFNDVSWNITNPTSAFEFMANTTFSTFNTFASGATNTGGFTTKYVKDHPGSGNPNFGMRFRNTLANGLNFSLNYYYSYDSNPAVNLSWHDSATGEKLTVQRAPSNLSQGGMPDLTQNLTPDQVNTNLAGMHPGPQNNVVSTSVLLHNSKGEYYGAFAPSMDPSVKKSTNPHHLRFTETLNRIHSIGASFDYATNLGAIPTVFRGEFLYQKDTMQPIIDKRLLTIGDIANSLTMQESDMAKLVLGVDFSVMTNLLISAQFIQFTNLDFKNDKRNCFTQYGQQFDCSTYTGDFATLHMTNGLNKGYEHKEFFSLFFSKPFGESQKGRWNNITIAEEGGGYWNRFDVEYAVTDEFIVTAELNTYWGDDDTTFGQFEDSSNIQVGLKMLF